MNTVASFSSWNSSNEALQSLICQQNSPVAAVIALVTLVIIKLFASELTLRLRLRGIKS